MRIFKPMRGGDAPLGVEGDMAVLAEGGSDTPSPTKPESGLPVALPETTPAEKKSEEPPPAPPKKEEGEEEEIEVKEPEDETEDEFEDIPESSARPAFKDIKKEFPDVFKKYPQLRDAYFREAKYTTLFPTIEDAEEASGKSQAFDKIEASVLVGDSGDLLDSIHERDPEALRKFASNFLQTVHSRSRDLYAEVTDPLARNLIRYVHGVGQQRGDKNLQNAALLVSQLLYGDLKIPDAPRTALPENGSDPEKDRLREENQNFRLGQEVSFRKSYLEGAKDGLVKEIRKGLESLNPFMRDAVINKTMEEVGNILQKDASHMSRMDSLLKRAARDGFSPEWGPRVLSAYLGGARPHLPGIRRRLLEEALGKQPGGQNPPSGNKGKNLPGSHVPTPNKTGPVDPRKVDWRRTSDEDFLNDRVTFKK